MASYSSCYSGARARASENVHYYYQSGEHEEYTERVEEQQRSACNSHYQRG